MLSEEMAAKEKQNVERFDLCKEAAARKLQQGSCSKEAAAMKQIIIASLAKDRKKTVGGKITNK